MKLQSASSALCHRFLNDDGAVAQTEEKKGRTSTVEATHVGPFTPHFSFPKYPSPLLLPPPPETFPSVCIFLSLHPPLSPALRLIDSTTKCLRQMISERRRLSNLSGRIEPPRLLPLASLCLLGAFWKLARLRLDFLTYVPLLTQQQKTTHN